MGFADALFQDVRYAVRTLRKSPAFALTAIAALALGIGANTAIFSVINGVLLRPLTYPDPEHIVYFYLQTPQGPAYGASPTNFNLWRAQTQVFQDVAAYEYAPTDVQLAGEETPARAVRVSVNYFRLLGAPLALGRMFTAEEDRPHGSHVAIISNGFWERRFASDPNAVGKSLSLGGDLFTIVGVLGRGFNSELDVAPDLWLPFQIDPESIDQGHFFNVIGRLKPGVTMEAANARLGIATEEFRQRFPKSIGRQERFAVQPFAEAIVSDARPALLILAGAVSLVLLIACANVANLLLARATGRKREVAIRTAVGAGRGRIARQLLTESVVLSLLGGSVGCALGILGVKTLLAVNPGDLPRIGQHGAYLAPDGRVLAFSLLVSLGTGIVFGLIPALGATRFDLGSSLKEGGRSGTGLRQNRTRAALVVCEIALAFVLLVGASLLIRTFIAVRSVNPGFDATNVLTLRMSLAKSGFMTARAVEGLLLEGIQRMQATPGVTAATAGYLIPMEGAYGIPFHIVRGVRVEGPYDGRGWLGVGDHYFEVFKIPVMRGRVFNDRDRTGSAPVAVINESLARRFWPKGDAIGERILLGSGYGPEFEEPAREIIGVVADVRNDNLEDAPKPVVYVPMAQVTDGLTARLARRGSLVWVARTTAPTASLGNTLRKELQETSGGQPVTQGLPMTDVVRKSTARRDFQALLLSIFGGSALALAAIGIYGLIAYSVQQRAQEMSIRLALGASAGQIRNLIVLQGMRLTLAGVMVGGVAAFGLARFIASLLFGVTPWDPVSFVATPLVLGAVALVAAWTPARRAGRADAIAALRSE